MMLCAISAKRLLKPSRKKVGNWCASEMVTGALISDGEMIGAIVNLVLTYLATILSLRSQRRISISKE